MSADNINVTSDQIPEGEFEVNFDENITDLYKAITDSDWDAATKALGLAPKEARTWVVRYHEGTKDVMWRFLPLHSACARNPPTAFASALIEAYPEAAQSVDDQGMYPLHYACGNQAARQVIRSLLVAFPKGAKLTDPKGMLPIHHLACWGPSKVSVIDMILFANRDVAECKDEDGNTPMDLAKDADYEEKDDVIEAMERWFKRKETKKKTSVSTTHTSRESRNVSRSAVSVSSQNFADNDDTTISTATGGLEKRTSELKEKLERKEQRILELKSQCFDFDTKARVAVVELQKLQEVIKTRDEQLKESDDTIRVQTESYEALQQQKEENESALTTERDTLKATLEKATESMKASAEKAGERIQFLENLLDEKETELREKEAIIAEKDNENAKLTQQLEDKKEQYETLRDVKGDMDQAMKDLVQDTIDTKIDKKDERFDSLSAALATLMEQQSELVKSIQEREMRSTKSKELRRQRMLELMEAEEHEAADDGDIELIADSLDKQAGEMDSIAAILSEIRI